MKELVLSRTPRLYDGGGNIKVQWYIEYYCTHPVTHALERNKCSKKFYSLKTLEERYAYAEKRIIEIQELIAAGKHPYFMDKHLPSAEQKALLNTGMKKVEKLMRSTIPKITTSTEEKTLRTFNGYLNHFLEWLEKRSVNNQNVATVSEDDGHEYLNHLITEKNFAVKTRNEHLVLLRNIFDYLVRLRHCTFNPFKEIDYKKTNAIHRRQFREHLRIPIIEYLKEHDPILLLYISMIYYSMRRNSEITQLKISDIDLMEGVIEIRPEVGKTDRSGYVQIPVQLFKMLRALKLNQYPASYFLFGRSGQPGFEPIGKNFFYKRWKKVRTEFNLPVELGIYNWKHTGIILGIKSGLSELEIKNQAGWTTNRMIDVYTRDMDPLEEGRIRNEMPAIDVRIPKKKLYTDQV